MATSERGIEHWEPFDLAEVTAAVVDSRRGHATGLGLRLETILKPAPCTGAPDLVARLVTNLVDNAVRYNRPDGQVEIVTGTDTDHTIVRVGNTEPPIPADRIAVLFEPFQRLSNARTRHDSSHGLGLSIVAAVATAHHAEIIAHPGSDGGLDVTVRFSIGAPGDQAVARAAAPWSPCAS